MSSARSIATALLAGLLFGAGLVVSGMTQPEKIIGFLDVGGQWDPSLAFVMAGAVGVYAVLARVIAGRAQPWFGSRFRFPPSSGVDGKLVLGAAVFGVGWGLSGYCPGPALVAAGAASKAALVFVPAMALGMILQRFALRRIQPPPETSSE